MAKGSYVRIHKNDLKRLAKASPKKADEALAALAEEGRTIAVLSMQESPATGNTYRRGSVTHTSASPGNPPRPDTGQLVNSLQTEKVRLKVHRVYTSVEYAQYLEYGSTRWAGGISFPFMGPMALAVGKLIPRFFDKFLEDEVS